MLKKRVSCRKLLAIRKGFLYNKRNAVVVVFAGAIAPMEFAWTMADITMGGMTLINIPCCLILSGTVFKALRDYEKQKKQGKTPVFRAANIGLDEDELHYWKTPAEEAAKESAKL